jgi:hypothetical protein
MAFVLPVASFRAAAVVVRLPGASIRPSASIAGIASRRIGALRAESQSVQVEGPSTCLVDRLKPPLLRVLSKRPGYYVVSIDSVGRVGEVLVSIQGPKGRLPLIFAREDLEPGYVHRVVEDAVIRFDF